MGKHAVSLWLMVRSASLLLSATGLTRLAARSALAFEVFERETHLQRLSRAFSGLRVLHLSDLHLGSRLDLAGRLRGVLKEVTCDVAVITGDFRFHERGSFDRARRELDIIVGGLAPRYGIHAVLGNHDRAVDVTDIESCGVRVLMNESTFIERQGERLWLVGVDDPHLYRMDDLPRALEGVPADDPRILLAHSPELHQEAANASIDLYLCGHTHGGQICLPGGFAPFVQARCPRRYARGAWCHDGVEGYTSRGVGASGIGARLFCPPEIIVHRLVGSRDPRPQPLPASEYRERRAQPSRVEEMSCVSECEPLATSPER